MQAFFRIERSKMLKRLYIHNYKAFQNFEIKFDDLDSMLCLGKNGAGKSSLVEVFHIFQKIGEGKSQLSDLIDKSCFNFIKNDLPMQLELEVELQNEQIKYLLLLDFPNDFNACRVIKEQLTVNDIHILDRENGEVSYKTKNNQEIADFFLDWHIFALPIFKPRKQELISIQNFKNWLANIIVISPIPALMANYQNEQLALKPNYFSDNLNSWITKLFSEKPRSYQYIYEYLNLVFPDLEEIDNSEEQLSFKFKGNGEGNLKLSQLSYGERIFVLWSAILASVKLGLISVCVWDEPENYISLLEIQFYFNTLKQNFDNKALFIATSHNPETIRMFPTDDIFILSRKNHFEPVRLQFISELGIKNDIVDLINAGLVEL